MSQRTTEDDQRPEPELPREELIQRVLYSLLTPVSRFTRSFELPLKEVVSWTQLAYFHELRRHGLTLQQTADALNVSMRKASQLSAQLKSNFFSPERDHALPRRVEFLLWAEPMSAARVKQLLRGEHDEAEVDEALALLLEQDRAVLREQGTTEVYELSRRSSRMYQNRWMPRIDGLNHMLGLVSRVVLARFFAGDPRAFARTVTLHVRPGDLDALTRFYQEELWPFLVSLDRDAEGADDRIPIDLSVLWAPHDPPDGTPDTTPDDAS